MYQMCRSGDSSIDFMLTVDASSVDSRMWKLFGGKGARGIGRGPRILGTMCRSSSQLESAEITSL
jgi:hypothetical protein